MIDRYKQDIQIVAAGGPPSAAVVAEQEHFRAAPLSEGSIEGYHAVVAHILSRAHGAKAPIRVF